MSLINRVKQAHSSERSIDLISVTCLLGLVVLLWVPFGNAVKPLVEEWGLIEVYGNGGGVFHIREIDDARPLGTTFTYIAYVLDPINLQGFFFLLISLVALKGLAIYSITRFVSVSHLYAFLVASLYVVMPADQGIFTYRTLNIHGASLLYFLALYFFLSTLRSDRTMWPRIFGMVGCLVWSLMAYDAGYPLAIATPFFLFAFRRGSSARRRFLVFIWVSTVLVCALYTTVQILGGENAYQPMIFRQPTIWTVLYAPALGIARHFVVGWLEALSLVFTNLFFTLVALLAGYIGVIAASRLLPPTNISYRTALWRFGPLVVLGVCVIVLGVMAYIPTASYTDTWRVYYYASFGGAVSIAALIMLLASRYGKQTAMIMVAVLIGLGTLHAIHQHAAFAVDSAVAQELLDNTIQEVPRPPFNTTFIYLRRPAHGSVHRELFFHHGYLVSALRILYGYRSDIRDAFVCRDNTCRVTDQIVSVPVSESRTLIFPRRHITLLDYVPEVGYVSPDEGAT